MVCHKVHVLFFSYNCVSTYYTHQALVYHFVIWTSETVRWNLRNLKQVLSKFVLYSSVIFVSFPDILKVFSSIRTRKDLSHRNKLQQHFNRNTNVGTFCLTEEDYGDCFVNVVTFHIFSFRFWTDRRKLIFIIHHWNSLTLARATHNTDSRPIPGRSSVTFVENRRVLFRCLSASCNTACCKRGRSRAATVSGNWYLISGCIWHNVN
jgi:hypothetical protein